MSTYLPGAKVNVIRFVAPRAIFAISPFFPASLARLPSIGKAFGARLVLMTTNWAVFVPAFRTTNVTFPACTVGGDSWKLRSLITTVRVDAFTRSPMARAPSVPGRARSSTPTTTTTGSTPGGRLILAPFQEKAAAYSPVAFHAAGRYHKHASARLSSREMVVFRPTYFGRSAPATGDVRAGSTRPL